MQTAGDRPPYLAVLLVTGALLGLVVVMLTLGGYEALVGSVIGLVAGYWLPTRPNRNPPN